MVAVVEYVDKEFIPLDDGSYRWLDLKRFRFDGDVSDEDLLLALVSHRRYQDHYATDDEHWEPTGNLHGPYWLDRINLESFETVDAPTARAVIRQWAEQHDGHEGRGFATLIETATGIIDNATSLWCLRDLGENAEHDWGRVLDDFHEVVAISKVNHVLTLLVVSAD